MTRPSAKASGLINRYAEAVRQWAFRGTILREDERREVEERYARVRTKLEEYIAELEQK